MGERVKEGNGARGHWADGVRGGQWTQGPIGVTVREGNGATGFRLNGVKGRGRAIRAIRVREISFRHYVQFLSNDLACDISFRCLM